MTPIERHLLRERRKLDAVDRAITLITTHPDVDPVERLCLVRLLASIDRRTI